jgi:Tol biopolymer transport system component
MPDRFRAAALVALIAFSVATGPLAADDSPPGGAAPLPSGPVLAFVRADGALAAAAESADTTVRIASARGAELVSHSWSPDGRRIAFTRCRGRNCIDGSVFTSQADGSRERLFVPGAGAVWMADGKHVLVDRADRPGQWVVAVRDGARRAYSVPGLSVAPLSPRVSPDGRWLLHLTAPYGRVIPSPYAPHHAYARNWLFITDLASGRSRKVSGQRGWYSIGTAPWSPDRRRFAFTRREFLQAPGGQLYVSSPTRVGSDLVARGARDGGAWSPDGARLVFNGSGCAIRIVSLQGEPPARTLPFTGCLPTWRPTQ